MKLTAALKHLTFENLPIKPKGVILFSVSPFEQNPVKGQVASRIPNLARRLRDRMFIYVFPMVWFYVASSWMVKENERLKRKNPADYENDE